MISSGSDTVSADVSFFVHQCGHMATQPNKTGSDQMKCFLSGRRTYLLMLLGALTVSMFVAGGTTAAPQAVDQKELVASGFKTLVATTSVQKEWVHRLTPGQIRPLQRNGKKFFIYPDASRDQIYVGGPKEYDAYLQLHPGSQLAAREAAKKGNAYRAKQDEQMKEATARDLTDPFLGADWVDLGWDGSTTSLSPRR